MSNNPTPPSIPLRDEPDVLCPKRSRHLATHFYTSLRSQKTGRAAATHPLSNLLAAKYDLLAPAERKAMRARLSALSERTSAPSSVPVQETMRQTITCLLADFDAQSHLLAPAEREAMRAEITDMLARIDRLETGDLSQVVIHKSMEKEHQAVLAVAFRQGEAAQTALEEQIEKEDWEEALEEQIEEDDWEVVERK
jgi:hypothetical protein